MQVWWCFYFDILTTSFDVELLGASMQSASPHLHCTTFIFQAENPLQTSLAFLPARFHSPIRGNQFSSWGLFDFNRNTSCYISETSEIGA